MGRVRRHWQHLEEGGDNRWSGDHAGDARRRCSPRSDLGTGRHDHLRDQQRGHRPADRRQRRWADDGADAARPKAGRSRSRLAGMASGRSRGAVHDHGGDRRAGCRSSGGAGSTHRTHTVLVRGGSHAHYVPDSPHSPSSRNWTGSLTRAGGEGGHLIYASASTLRAVPFDLGRLETRGTAVPVVGDVVTTANGAVYADVGDEGTLAYVPGGMAAPPVTRMVWVDRQGRETPIPTPTLSVFGQPRLSPDGTQIVAFSTSQEVDLWVWNLRRGILTRATFDPGIDAFPLWTPDGRRLIFSSERAGAANIWQSAVDGSAVERLTESPNVQRPSAVSPDGRRLIFSRSRRRQVLT